MSESAQSNRAAIRATIEANGQSCAEFADLTLEDFDVDDRVDYEALRETWSATQPL